MTIYRVFEQDTTREIFEHIIKIERHEIELEQELAKLKEKNEELVKENYEFRIALFGDISYE